MPFAYTPPEAILVEKNCLASDSRICKDMGYNPSSFSPYWQVANEDGQDMVSSSLGSVDSLSSLTFALGKCQCRDIEEHLQSPHCTSKPIPIPRSKDANINDKQENNLILDNNDTIKTWEMYHRIMTYRVNNYTSKKSSISNQTMEHDSSSSYCSSSSSSSSDFSINSQEQQEPALTYDQCEQSAYDDDGVFDFEW